jgi:hypothetical protein
MLTALAAALPVLPASAGTPTLDPITFETQVGGCPAGYATPGQQVNVTLKEADGTSIGSSFTWAEGGGFWQVCLGPAATAGRRITASYSAGQLERTVTVPRITAVLDRVTNRARGTAAPGATLMIELWTCVPGDCSIASQANVTAAVGGPTKGRWSKTYTAVDPAGGDHVRAYRITTSDAGEDRFFVEAYAPQLTVRATQPWNAGLLAAKTGEVAVEILERTGRVRGRITHRFLRPTYRVLTFKKNGVRVTPRPGDRIVSTTLAPDVAMTLPTSLTVEMDALGDQIRVRCFANQRYQITIIPAGGGDARFLRGTTPGSGLISVAEPLDALDTAFVECRHKRGDRLLLRGEAPPP